VSNRANDVVVVTGAAQGIGLETARWLTRDGYRVVGLDIKEPEAPDVFERFVNVDLRSEEAIQESLARLHQDLGSPYGLVNNAVVAPLGQFLEADVGDLDAAYSVNIRGAFLTAREVARSMVASGSQGSIVNLASVNGERGVAGTMIYSITKGALITFTRCLAVELAPHGIRCNAVAPAPTATPRQMAAFSEEQIAERISRIPQGRLADPVNVAHAIAYLLGSQASFITGVVLPVDGGYLAYGSGLKQS
jgi:3-oxoacyl-[acyl-carrier protein] reductase